jgi:hypothetical protein
VKLAPAEHFAEAAAKGIVHLATRSALEVPRTPHRMC